MIYDINLIPKNRKNASGKSSHLILLIFLLCALVLGVFGFYFPYLKKESLNDQIHKQEKELAAFSDTDATYINLLSESERISQANDLLDQIKNSEVNMTDIMKYLNDNTPLNTSITNFSYDAGLITLEGQAPSYAEMAKFIVKLRKMDDVYDVSITHAEVEEIEENGTQAANAKKVNKFSLYVRLNSIDAFSLIEQATATSEEATDDEVKEGAQDEANQ